MFCFNQAKKIGFFQQIVKDSDVIIYDLNNCDPVQAQLVIKTLKMNTHNSTKILIFISSVLTWAQTHPKQKNEQQQDDGLFPQEPDTQQQNQGNEQSPQDDQPKKVYTRFTQSDFRMRQSDPAYQEMRSLQTMCISLTKKQNVKSYVLCSGILYGQGQLGFYQMFKQGWLQQPKSLNIYGKKGRNRIPCIHLQDLITFIIKIIQRPPSVQYIFGIDQNPKPTQKRIIQAISSGIGSGQIKHINQQSQLLFINLNLRFKPSSIFAKLQQEQANLQADQGQQIDKFKFDWHCKQGIQKNIGLLNVQFNQFNNLKQIKIMIGGPPASGKSKFCKKIAQNYNIPYIGIKETIDSAVALQNQFGQQLRNALSSNKQKLIQQGQTAYQQAKQKMKLLPKDKRTKIPAFDPDNVIPRLEDEYLSKVFIWRLQKNDCRNRGFVLDGYPTTYAQAKSVFMCNPPVKQDEPVDQQNIVKIINNKSIPDSVVILKAADQYLINKCMKLSQKEIQNTHYTQKQMKRRLNNYRQKNDQSTGDFVVSDFFQQNQIPIVYLDIQNQQNQPLQDMISFVQRNGSFKNYKQDQTRQQRRLQQVRKMQEEMVIKNNELQKKRDQVQQEKRTIQLQQYHIKKQNQANLQRDVLDKKSLSLLPILTQGILKLCNQTPDDPVDFLAQFLFRQSIRVFKKPSS